MIPPDINRERVRKYAEARKREGLRRVQIWAHPDDVPRLKATARAMLNARRISYPDSPYPT